MEGRGDSKGIREVREEEHRGGGAFAILATGWELALGMETCYFRDGNTFHFVLSLSI